jgi:hypothetical protein
VHCATKILCSYEQFSSKVGGVPKNRIFWLKHHFPIGRHDNKEKRLFYFGLRIRLPIQIQLLNIENPKNPKIDSP